MTPTAPPLPAGRRLADRLPQLLGLAAVALLLALLAGLAVWQGRTRQQGLAVGAAQNLARLLETEVADTLGQADLLLRAAAAQWRQSTSGADDLDSSAAATLRALAATSPDLLDLRMANAQGQWRVRPDPTAAGGASGGNVHDSEAFQRARSLAESGLILTGPLRHRPDSPWVLVLSRGLHNNQGQFAGLVSVDLPVSRIDALWAAIDLGDGGSASLRTAAGALVSQRATPPDEPATIGSTDLPTPLRDALALNPLAGEVETAAAPDGSHRIGVYRQMQHTPLVLQVALPAQDFVQRWTLWDSTAAALALGVLAAVGLGAAAQRRAHRQTLSDAVRQLAFDDPLTGLPNRRLLLDRLARVQQASQRLGSMAALLVINLETLDRGGTAPAATDNPLLRAAALGLQAALRKSDTVTWLGKDRFGLLCDNLGADPVLAGQRVLALVAKIHQALAQRLGLDGETPRCTVHIGQRLFRGDGEAPAQLIAEAVLAAGRQPTYPGPVDGVGDVDGEGEIGDGRDR